ncbi:MAG: hypothetical protein RMX68_030940 [Aulosira sp. ZfuVER01]|nr:hypothetical protein [Aulosira sp. ZfuVER01]MDZ7996896.1 hypothetical protein [Aulosira sp. DedVER01a]MDZ8050022.1 hypothetical protein [Aulosira sp. ZfuCHP01]
MNAISAFSELTNINIYLCLAGNSFDIYLFSEQVSKNKYRTVAIIPLRQNSNIQQCSITSLEFLTTFTVWSVINITI